MCLLHACVFFDLFFQDEQEVYGLGSNVGSSSSSRGLGRYQGGGGGQWKPALQSIAEVGT